MKQFGSSLQFEVKSPNEGGPNHWQLSCSGSGPSLGLTLMRRNSRWELKLWTPPGKKCFLPSFIPLLPKIPTIEGG